MKANTKSPKILTSPTDLKKNKPADPMEAVYQAIGTLTRDCEKTRNNAAISVAKCYASANALVELLVEKQLLTEADKEVYLLKSLRLFHESSRDDIKEGLAELESGKSIAPENIVKGMKEELEYHEEILSQIAAVTDAVIKGEKTYHEFIKELSDHLNTKYNLK